MVWPLSYSSENSSSRLLSAYWVNLASKLRFIGSQGPGSSFFISVPPIMFHPRNHFDCLLKEMPKPHQFLPRLGKWQKLHTGQEAQVVPILGDLETMQTRPCRVPSWTPSSSAEGCGSPQWWRTCQVSHLHGGAGEGSVSSGVPRPGGLSPPPTAVCVSVLVRMWDVSGHASSECVSLHLPARATVHVLVHFPATGLICSLLGLLPFVPPQYQMSGTWSWLASSNSYKSVPGRIWKVWGEVLVGTYKWQTLHLQIPGQSSKAEEIPGSPPWAPHGKT